MPDTKPLLVYRDRIGMPSEVEFLRRQYIGFTRLHPVWLGRSILPGAERLGDQMLLGGNGPVSPLQRLLFRHLGYAPKLPFRPSVLHAQFARGGALALPLKRALRLRMAVTLHGGDISKQRNWRHGVLARRWPDVLREADRFICVSTAVARVAASRGVPDQKLAVLPIGVEIPDQPQYRTPAGYLFIGRFVEKKGIAVLADAMRCLRSQGDPTPLVCVGDGPLRPVLETLARDSSGITLTGWLPPDSVQQHVRKATALLVPSIIAADGDAEGLPSVIPEAMAQACPVIGSNQGGIAEAIYHEQTGLLIPPGDPNALASAMHRLGSNPTFAASLGEAAYAAAAVSLNAHLQSAKLEALLLSL